MLVGLVCILDGLEGIADVMIHLRYYLQSTGKILSSSALIQKTDQPNNYTAQQVVREALHACEPQTERNLIYQDQEEENDYTFNDSTHGCGKGCWSLLCDFSWGDAHTQL